MNEHVWEMKKVSRVVIGTIASAFVITYMVAHIGARTGGWASDATVWIGVSVHNLGLMGGIIFLAFIGYVIWMKTFGRS